MADDEMDTKNATVDREFAKRMKIACDNIPGMPFGKGRAAWIQREMNIRGVETSLNTVYRWYEGSMRPRPNKMKILAEVLKVDTAWLANGTVPELNFEEKKHFDASADASVNILMGFIQMAGWNCAFPEEDDPNKSAVHFYSIINGRQRRFYVCYGLKGEKTSYSFDVPPFHEKTIVIGLIDTKPLEVEMVRLPTVLINDAGESHNGLTRVTANVTPQGWNIGNRRIPALRDIREALVD